MATRGVLRAGCAAFAGGDPGAQLTPLPLSRWQELSDWPGRRVCPVKANRLSPHSLRHTTITAALDAGVSLRDVQDYAGHADPRMTRRYDRARYSLDRHATYALAAYLAER